MRTQESLGDRGTSMNTHFKLLALPSLATAAGILLTVAMASIGSLASTPNFVVPEDTQARRSMWKEQSVDAKGPGSGPSSAVSTV